MKKFITAVPLQPEDKLFKNRYEAVGNERLNYDEETSFPILAVMNGYVEEGEKIRLFTICPHYSNAITNLRKLREEVKVLCQKKKCECEIVVIETEYNESVENHLQTFCNLIEKIEDEDIIFACLSFGTKMIPIVELMTINYTYRAKWNTSVGCMVYGGFDFENNRAKLYDITSLFYVDEVVRKLGDLRVENPLKYISDMLDR